VAIDECVPALVERAVRAAFKARGRRPVCIKPDTQRRHATLAIDARSIYTPSRGGGSPIGTLGRFDRHELRQNRPLSFEPCCSFRCRRGFGSDQRRIPFRMFGPREIITLAIA